MKARHAKKACAATVPWHDARALIAPPKESAVMLRVVALVLPIFIASCTGAAATTPVDSRTPAKAQAAKTSLPDNLVLSDDLRVSGAVLETMSAGPYTYVRLNTADGEIWAAVNEVVLKPGTEVTIGDAMWMEKFESKTLNRTFDRILFGNLRGGDGGAVLPAGHPATTGMAAPQAPPTGPGSGTGEPADVKVDKAPGKEGRTVAEIHASKAALNGKEVEVRGKVVKWNADIMGRNWLHLRDGSGSPDKQDNDITVTTSDVVAKGDIVIMRGKVALDKDFTAGYTYPVIVEDARVVK
jgi:hypothetical protein